MKRDNSPRRYSNLTAESEYIKQNLIEMQREIYESTLIIGDFIITLLERSRFGRQKIKKSMVKLSSTIKQLAIMDIYRLLLSTIELHIPFKLTWNFSKLNHTLDHKIHLNKCKRGEFIPSMFTDHSGKKQLGD